MTDLESLVLSDSESAIFQEGLRQGEIAERNKKPRPVSAPCGAAETTLKEIARAIHAPPERLREMAEAGLEEAGVRYHRRRAQ